MLGKGRAPLDVKDEPNERPSDLWAHALRYVPRGIADVPQEQSSPATATRRLVRDVPIHDIRRHHGQFRSAQSDYRGKKYDARQSIPRVPADYLTCPR